MQNSLKVCNDDVLLSRKFVQYLYLHCIYLEHSFVISTCVYIFCKNLAMYKLQVLF